jgi:hypothetical protein
VPAVKQTEAKATVITPTDIAKELEIEPRQFRVFLRSRDMNVGRGKRYGFSKREADRLKAAYLKANTPKDDDGNVA